MDAELTAVLGRILAKAQAPLRTVGSGQPRCGAEPWPGEARSHGKIYCRGSGAGAHHVQADPGAVDLPTQAIVVLARCPITIAEQIQEALRSERERLAGLLARAGVPTAEQGFAGFDVRRCPLGPLALGALQRFAAGRPPQGQVLLSGDTGTGKTRLLLSSHLTLVGNGIRSAYRTSAELRALFRDLGHVGDVRVRAETELGALLRMEALHLDDLGEAARGEPSFHGSFRQGMKQLLEQARGARAIALNLTASEALEHPDLGERIVSRLLQDATIVRLEGGDARVRSAQALRDAL